MTVVWKISVYFVHFLRHHSITCFRGCCCCCCRCCCCCWDVCRVSNVENFNTSLPSFFWESLSEGDKNSCIVFEDWRKCDDFSAFPLLVQWSVCSFFLCSSFPIYSKKKRRRSSFNCLSVCGVCATPDLFSFLHSQQHVPWIPDKIQEEKRRVSYTYIF